MTEVLLNEATQGKTTYLANGDIIFKDIGGDFNYQNELDHHHTFDAGVGYKVVMGIKGDWQIEVDTVDSSILYDRLGFRTKETSGSDWVNGNVPWFRKTIKEIMGTNVWGQEAGLMGDGWVLPPKLSSLDDLTTYNDVRGTAVNSFIPINYVGDAQIICWHFFSDLSIVKPGWEIKITRVAVSDNAGSDNAGSDNAVTCKGNGKYTISGGGSITCS